MKAILCLCQKSIVLRQGQAEKKDDEAVVDKDVEKGVIYDDEEDGNPEVDLGDEDSDEDEWDMDDDEVDTKLYDSKIDKIDEVLFVKDLLD